MNFKRERLHRLEYLMNEAVETIRTQQDIIALFDRSDTDSVLLKLHRSGLRSFCQMERIRDEVGKSLGLRGVQIQ